MSKGAATRRLVGAGESLYEEDFYAWTQRTAALLRMRQFGELDLEHAAEEIEDMGKRDAKELRSRMRVLLMHLLKWEVEPKRRSRSWRATITEQRQEIADVLEDSPSLRRQLGAILPRCYRDAVARAAAEMGLAADRFPRVCPYALAQVLEPSFLPE